MKKNCAITLSAILFAVGLLFPVTSSAQIGPNTIEKMRTTINQLSLNRERKVEIKFTDKTKLKGYITAVGPDSFTFSESNTGTAPQTIKYSEVAEARKAGNGLSTKTWLIVGGVALGTIVTWTIVKPAVCDGGAQSRGIC